MAEPFLLSRVLLQFSRKDDDLRGELSAVAFTPDGSIWVGSDEMRTIEKLSPLQPCVYGDHQSLKLKDYVELFNEDGEVDIEGLDYADGYLWFTGSHSQKREKADTGKTKKDIKNLGVVKQELNRYLLGRIPIYNGELFRTFSSPDDPDTEMRAATLEKSDGRNILMDALENDEHLGTYVRHPLPNKENGLDIEGIAVRENRILLGLRGPVLGGWAVILEIEVEETEPGVLGLKEIGENGRLYCKHFVDLGGRGIRELCLRGDDVIILAGPTMDIEGTMHLYLLKDAINRDKDCLFSQDDKELELILNLPFSEDANHPEGLTLMPCLGFDEALLVVYDLADKSRMQGKKEVFMDVFRLPE